MNTRISKSNTKIHKSDINESYRKDSFEKRGAKSCKNFDLKCTSTSSIVNRSLSNEVLNLELSMIKSGTEILKKDWRNMLGSIIGTLIGTAGLILSLTLLSVPLLYIGVAVSLAIIITSLIYFMCKIIINDHYNNTRLDDILKISDKKLNKLHTKIDTYCLSKNGDNDAVAQTITQQVFPILMNIRQVIKNQNSYDERMFRTFILGLNKLLDELDKHSDVELVCHKIKQYEGLFQEYTTTDDIYSIAEIRSDISRKISTYNFRKTF